MTDEPQFSTWEEAVQWLRNQPRQGELVMAAYYDDPLLAAASRYAASEEWNAIQRLLPKTRGKALDVGAGRGIASFALAREGFQVTALEPDGSELVGAAAVRSLAQETGLPIAVTQEFSEKLPFTDGQFDIVFARAVLHHTRDLSAACSEFFRVLKPGGRLIAVREHVISKSADLDRFLEIHPLHRLYGGENAFLLDQYEISLQEAGFHLEKVITPLESPINYAPQTLNSLQHEIAVRASLDLPVLRGLAKRLIGIPWVWALLRPLLAKLDHRPGRLYSFIAKRA
jgi:SAM-dependent methyltransferase